jgi:hypothetical protein
MELGPDALNLAGAQAGARSIYSHLASSGPHKHVDGAGASASRMLGGDGICLRHLMTRTHRCMQRCVGPCVCYSGAPLYGCWHRRLERFKRRWPNLLAGARDVGWCLCVSATLLLLAFDLLLQDFPADLKEYGGLATHKDRVTASAVHTGLWTGAGVIVLYWHVFVPAAETRLISSFSILRCPVVSTIEIHA